MMHPLALVAPVANYVVLRYVGGDKENEAAQEQRYFKEKSPKYGQLQDYKASKNSFWPDPTEVYNEWCWAVIAFGVGGVIVERVLRSALMK
jgi:hypothetical protein